MFPNTKRKGCFFTSFSLLSKTRGRKKGRKIVHLNRTAQDSEETLAWVQTPEFCEKCINRSYIMSNFQDKNLY